MNDTTEGSLLALQPAAVWAHFATLCRIPRPSKQEGPLREHLRQWAEARGLAATVDEAGNLLVRKPASPGREEAPGLVLQGHLDMVCQKNSDVAHDFTRDAIRPVVADGWVQAEGTTLGSDNGIGVAMILALLESADVPHGPLEALFTVDEEAGMGGAQGLRPGVLQGRLMLNLDTEEWGEFYLGCAGGVDVNVARPGTPAPWPAGHLAYRISLTGLRGGHSGVNIHEERGNAIKLLVRVLRGLEELGDLRLVSLHGGTARNALPREAFATVAVPESLAASRSTHDERAARRVWTSSYEGLAPGLVRRLPIRGEPRPRRVEPRAASGWTIHPRDRSRPRRRRTLLRRPARRRRHPQNQGRHPRPPRRTRHPPRRHLARLRQGPHRRQRPARRLHLPQLRTRLQLRRHPRTLQQSRRRSRLATHRRLVQQVRSRLTSATRVIPSEGEAVAEEPPHFVRQATTPQSSHNRVPVEDQEVVLLGSLL